MIYLCLAILSSAFVSVFMRLGEGKIQNNMGMFIINYLTCIVVARILMGPVRLFTAEPGMGFVVLLGSISGFLYLAGFVLLQTNIQKNGIVMASIFMRLGVVIPIIMAMIAFHEKPEILQILGIILALISIVLFNFEKGNMKLGQYRYLLFLLLLCGGITDSMINIYDKVGVAALKDHYLFFNFFVAMLCAIVMFFVRKQKLTKWDVLFGILLGVPNYFSSRFLMHALSNVPAVIAYPAYSVGTIVAISLTGILFFHEKLGKQKYIAIGIVIVALILLNI